GLTVEVAAPRDPTLRAEVVRRRMAYDADPVAFAASYDEAERALTDRIQAAQKLVGEVELTDAALLKIAEVCAAFDVDGLRADIVTARAAVAHAAWHGRSSVVREDIRAAARLALPHRRRRNPFDAPGLDEDLLDQVLGDDEPPEPTEPPEPEGVPEEVDGEPTETSDAADDPGTSYESAAPATSSYDVPEDQGGGGPAGTSDAVTVAGAAAPYRPKLFTVRGTGAGEAGRRSRAVTETGRRIGASPGDHGSIHLTETIRAAAPFQVLRGRDDGPLRFRGSDLRVANREGQESNLILFCVDASGSMAARTRMEQVKTAILSLLLDAYQRRDKVGLVTFRGTGAELALPPTHSVDIAARRLEDLPAGGRTPLDAGLLEAHRALLLERVRDPRRRPLLVVVTDGRATNGPDAVARSRRAAELLAHDGIASLVIDCESGPMRMGLALALSVALQAEHVPVADVSAAALTDAVKGAA
ncbi:MAG: bchI, partial [Nocardioidaceae bacterium]|nr:bchI [Nocardioidaceae bacterium]